MSNHTFTNLREANAARQAEWDKDERISLSYRGNELAGETGEACNIIKKLERERLGIRGSRATVDQLADELADVLICADLIALAEGIDLEAAVARKFNATSEKVGLSTRLAQAGKPAWTPLLQNALEALRPFSALVIEAEAEEALPENTSVHMVIYGDGELGDLPTEDFMFAAGTFQELLAASPHAAENEPA